MGHPPVPAPVVAVLHHPPVLQPLPVPAVAAHHHPPVQVAVLRHPPVQVAAHHLHPPLRLLLHHHHPPVQAVAAHLLHLPPVLAVAAHYCPLVHHPPPHLQVPVVLAAQEVPVVPVLHRQVLPLLMSPPPPPPHRLPRCRVRPTLIASVGDPPHLPVD